MDNPYDCMVFVCIMNWMETLFPKTRAELLRILFTEAEASYHLRELARMSGLSIGSMQGEVLKLKQAGFITERRDGNRLYFCANKQNPIYAELRGIALKAVGIQEQLQKTHHKYLP